MLCELVSGIKSYSRLLLNFVTHVIGSLILPLSTARYVILLKLQISQSFLTDSLLFNRCSLIVYIGLFFA